MGSRFATMLTLCMLAGGPIASANTSVNTWTYTNGTVNGVLTDVHNANGGPGRLSHASSYVSNSGTVYSSVAPYPPVGSQFGQGTASASAAEGALRVFGSSSASTAGIVQNAMAAQSFARASWDDGLTISADPSHFRQAGFITANLIVSGSLSGNIGANGRTDTAFVDLTARILGTGMSAGDWSALPSVLRNACNGFAYCDRQYSGYWSGFNNGAGGVDTATYDGIPSIISLLIPIYFDLETALNYTLEAYTYPLTSTGGGGLGTSADGLVDYSSTLLWGGITGVFDAFGNPIFDFTVASVSGFDYLMRPNRGVPEPGTLLLLGSLLPLVAWRRRHVHAGR